MSLIDRAIVRLLPAVPKPVVRRLSAPYIAGPTLADAVRTVEELNAHGKAATFDVLGEEIRSEAEAARIVTAYEDVLTEIDARGLDANISVKPTALGLELGGDVFRANLEHVVAHAAARGNFVRVDMEDSSTTDETLRVYRDLRAGSHDNVGVVLQSSLRRTLADMRELTPLSPNVRICKGIYVEPAAIQFRDDEHVRASFLQSLDVLLAAGGYPAIATHDDWLIERTLERVAGMERDRYEFQMLLGVRPELGDRLVADGHRLRIYVPFGEEWYRYSLRRLQENPALAGTIARDTVGRLLPFG